MNEIAMNTSEKAFRVLARKLYGSRVDDAIENPASDGTLRDICTTPYQGAYGIAGLVVVINGSPPRGTFVTGPYGRIIYMDSEGSARRMIPGQAMIVWHYLAEMGYNVASRRAPFDEELLSLTDEPVAYG